MEGLRMRFGKKLTATFVVCASVTFVGTGVSGAGVFHGHWMVASASVVYLLPG